MVAELEVHVNFGTSGGGIGSVAELHAPTKLTDTIANERTRPVFM
jgi:hypothetical protein